MPQDKPNPKGLEEKCQTETSIKSVSENGAYQDSHRRSIVKALSYRITGSLTTAGVAWAMTGDARAAMAIGLSDTAIKLGLFYAHERIWEKINFGRTKQSPPDYQI